MLQLQHLLPLANAFVTILVGLEPFPLHDLNPKASVHGVVASEVAIRESPADLMTALVGDAFEVAHNVAVCLEPVNEHLHQQW